MATDLTVIEQSYPVLVPGSDAAQLIAANVAGEAIGVGDLDRIRVPAGGGTMWTVPSIEGDKNEKALEGIVVHVARRRAYWSNPNPTGDPPDCSSRDCLTGVGDPGGPCDACPFNEWASARKSSGEAGRGKACKESTLLFLLRPGNNMPEVVVVPPGSLRPVKTYRLKLPVPYFACLTRLELTKMQNKDGIAYAQIKPSYLGPLDPHAVARVRAYAKTLQGVFETVTIERDEVDGSSDEPF